MMHLYPIQTPNLVSRCARCHRRPPAGKERGLFSLQAILLLLSFWGITTRAFAQTQAPVDDKPIQVNVQGLGIAHGDALQDALRAAVGKAMGVAVKSQTTVENFMVVQDAIATNAQGYIKSYSITGEGPAPTGYQVTIDALVSSKPLEADAALLAQTLGGMRWLVAYDDRGLDALTKQLYQAVTDQANAYLASKRYRYIERSRFEALQREAGNMLEADAAKDSATLTYAQQLGLAAGAQFIIWIGDVKTDTRSEAFDTRTAARVSVNLKAYDNCTAEGLGTQSLTSDWQRAHDGNQAAMSGLSGAVSQAMPKLLETVNAYIGDWINQGVPYEIRFYGLGGYRDLRQLRSALEQDALFGGQMELTSMEGYTRLNGTFNRKPEQMADRVLDAADAIPTLAASKVDVRLMFGRQLNFAPSAAKVPALDKLKNLAIVGGGGVKGGIAPKPAAAVVVSGTPVKGKQVLNPRLKKKVK